MKRYILTGAPGAGKTAIIRALEVDGYAVVEEAATDIMALELARGTQEPWTHPSFVGAITALQRTRELRASAQGDNVQVYDRSPICTLALAEFLGAPVPSVLAEEVRRIEVEGIYERQVIFIETLGFVTPTEVRRISYEDALRFERLHEETYRRRGYDCVRIPAQPLAGRVMRVAEIVGRP